MAESKLNGAELVENTFGGWPNFHDAEILKIEFDRSGPSLWLHILASKPSAPKQQNRNTEDYKLRATHYKITFRFDVIDNLVLEGFNHQNVIWSIAFRQVRENRPNSGAETVEERLKIEVESVFGARCSFTCSGGEVTAVERTDLSTGDPNR